MATQDRVTLIIEGLPEDDGRVRAAEAGKVGGLGAVSGKVISQVDTIKALGEALSWFQREISWGSAAAALPHLTGRIGELFAAVTKNGEMATAVNQRGYDVMTKEGNERISVKTITSSNHVTFNAKTFNEVNRVLILKIVVDGDEISIETILDEDAATAKSLCTTDARGDFTYMIRRPATVRPLDRLIWKRRRNLALTSSAST